MLPFADPPSGGNLTLGTGLTPSSVLRSIPKPLDVDHQHGLIGQPTRSLAKGSKNDDLRSRLGNTVFIQAFYARNFR